MNFQICYSSSSNMSNIEYQLLFSLNEYQQWAANNTFRFFNTLCKNSNGKYLSVPVCAGRPLGSSGYCLYIAASPVQVLKK